MSKHKKWIYIAIGGVGSLALAVTGLFLVTNIAAAANGRTAAAASSPSVSVYYPGLGDDGSGSYDEALAEALGISADDLTAAYKTAYQAAIEQAVEDGDLTEDQAQRLLDRLDLSDNFHFGFGRHGIGSSLDEYLADALSISVDELAAARLEANQTIIQGAVDAGDLTQDEADLLLGQQAIQSYLADAMTTAYENAVQQALEDGAITEAQAQLLLENTPTYSRGFRGFYGHPGMMPGFGGRGSHGPHGNFGSNGDSQSSDSQDDVNGWFGFGSLDGV